MAQKRILIVEDEVIVAMTLEAVLQKLGYHVAGSVTNGPDAIRMAGEEMPDLVLMDIRLDGPMDGIEAATQISARYCIPVVYLTAHSDQSTLSRAIHTQPYGYLLKPFRERDLYTTIEMAFHKHRVIRQTGGGAPEVEATPGRPAQPPEPAPSRVPKSLAEMALDTIDVPVCVVDRDLRLVLFNAPFSQICARFGPGNPGLNQPVYLVAPAGLIGTTKDYLDAFSRMIPHTQESTTTHKGSEYITRTNFSPMKCGDECYVLTTIGDVTHARHLSSQNQLLFGAYEEVVGLLGELRSMGGNGKGNDLQQVATRAEQVVLALSQLDANRMKYRGKHSEKYLWEE